MLMKTKGAEMVEEVQESQMDAAWAQRASTSIVWAHDDYSMGSDDDFDDDFDEDFDDDFEEEFDEFDDDDLDEDEEDEDEDLDEDFD